MISDEERDRVKREIPEKFRASLDPAFEAGYLLLAENDAQQKIWSEKANTPFATLSPKQRERTNARVAIETLENAGKFQKLSAAQIEQLAESYAAIGEFHKAQLTSRDKTRKAEYKKYYKAVWLDDSKWCEHPDNHKYIKEYVWSLKEAKEMPLLACNICGMWNVMDAPNNLLEASRKRAEVREAVKGMSKDEVKRFLKDNRR